MDALMEFQNIGAGHSCVSLSKIMNNVVLISTTKCCIIPNKSFLESMMINNGNPSIAVHIKVDGEAKGVIIFMLEEESGKFLYKKMLNDESLNVNISSFDYKSALKEIGQIMAGSFISAVSDLLKIKLTHRMPDLSIGSPEAVMFDVCDKTFGDRDERISLATNILDKSSRLVGSIAYIPKKKTASVILEKMNVR
jgi:chemotaxis protein CheC